MASTNPAQLLPPSQPTTQPPLSALLTLPTLLPHLDFHLPSTPDFEALTRVWNLDLERNSAAPAAIIFPKTASEISTIINFCRTNAIPLTIKSGGHDMWGRSRVAGALTVDMARMRSMRISDSESEGKVVIVGGGAISQDVIRFLGEHNLTMPVGFCGGVGLVSWCCGGGYGLLSGVKGMGCDQIVGATIVDGAGEVRVLRGDDADLWAVRGAGASLGVVTELVLKAYVEEKGLYGFLAFPLNEAQSVLEKYAKLREESVGIDGPLGVELGIRGMGENVMFSFMFTWVEGSLEEGRKWLAKMKALGTCIIDSVAESTFCQWQTNLSSEISDAETTKFFGVFVEKLTPRLIEILVKHSAKLPDIEDPGSHSAIYSHTAHAAALSAPTPSSFGLRYRHLIIEIGGSTLSEDPAAIERNFQWAEAFHKDLSATGEVLKGGYVNLIERDKPMNECYGTEWERLLELKRKWDPDFVFRHGIPDLAVAYH